MARTSKLIDTEVIRKAQQGLKQIGKNALLARKLEAVLAASKHGIKQVAKIYDISRTSLTEWINRLKNGTLDQLCAPAQRKRKSIMVDDERKLIQEWLESDPQMTIDQVQQKFKIKTGKDVSRSTMHREMKKLNFSYITARKQHYKSNPEKVQEFKKKYSKPHQK